MSKNPSLNNPPRKYYGQPITFLDENGAGYGIRQTDNRPEVAIYGEDVILGGPAPIPVDRSGRYIPIIEPEHTRIHESFAYIHSHEHIVPNDGVVDHVLRNPAGNFPHMRWWRFIPTAAPGLVQVYRSPTISDIGPVGGLINLNDNADLNNNVVVYSEPVITDPGVLMYTDAIAGGKLQGGAPDKIISEILQRPSTDYLIRYTNRSGVTADVTTNIFWYETQEKIA